MRFLGSIILEIFSEYIIYSIQQQHGRARRPRCKKHKSANRNCIIYPLHMQYIAILQCSAVASGLHSGSQFHFQCHKKQNIFKCRRLINDQESFPNNIIRVPVHFMFTTDIISLLE